MGIYFGPNIGEFSATVTLENDKTIVALREGDDIHCDISLAFLVKPLMPAPIRLWTAVLAQMSAPTGTICALNKSGVETEIL